MCLAALTALTALAARVATGLAHRLLLLLHGHGAPCLSLLLLLLLRLRLRLLVATGLAHRLLLLLTGHSAPCLSLLLLLLLPIRLRLLSRGALRPPARVDESVGLARKRIDLELNVASRQRRQLRRCLLHGLVCRVARLGIRSRRRFAAALVDQPLALRVGLRRGRLVERRNLTIQPPSELPQHLRAAACDAASPLHELVQLRLVDSRELALHRLVSEPLARSQRWLVPHRRIEAHRTTQLLRVKRPTVEPRLRWRKVEREVAVRRRHKVVAFHFEARTERHCANGTTLCARSLGRLGDEHHAAQMARLARHLERLLALDHVARACRLYAHDLGPLQLGREEKCFGRDHRRVARAVALQAATRGRLLDLLVGLVVGLARLVIVHGEALEVAIRVGVRRVLLRTLVVGATRSAHRFINEPTTSLLPARA